MKKSIYFGKLLYFAFTMTCLRGLSQKFPGLAATPPMGWNSWNSFQVKINEQLIRQTTDAMVASGMKDAGYSYIILDDGWMSMIRDSTGSLTPNKDRFPNGIKALADYIHEKGLKIGIYNCAGTKTCGGFPGTRGYEYQDARLYASWGIDYLKLDWCNTEGINAKEAYGTMSAAIRTAGRPMVFSLCEWGTNHPWEWAAPIAQLWRTTQDIYRCFDCRYDHSTWYWAGPMQILDLQDALRKYAGPGHWNDPDMLEVGNGLSLSESRAHFSMWCMLAAPLIAGNDLRGMTADIGKLLTNRDVIAIDQDALGIEGFRYSRKDSLEIWFKPLQNGDWAVCFLNRGEVGRRVTFNWKEQPVVDTINGPYLKVFESKYQLYDLWTKQFRGTTDEPFVASVPSHDIILLRLKEVSKK